jgi:leucyl aminopeptidase
MTINIQKQISIAASRSIVVLTDDFDKLKEVQFSDDELYFIKKSIENKEKFIVVNQYKRMVFIQILPDDKDENEKREKIRRAAAKLKSYLNQNKICDIQIVETDNKTQYQIDYAEALALSHYQFLKYFENKNDKLNSLKNIFLVNNKVSDEEIKQLSALIEAVYKARTLVNEPVSFMDAEQMMKEAEALSKDCGFELEVLEKKQIESLKMGGLLAVNKGSAKPPKLMIMSWEPENAKNEQPIVLVGKGIVMDTGGYSLKPTADSMDYMKSDMGGAAAVIGTMAAVSKAGLPVKLIGLVPMTDNAIGPDAYMPGDVITMHNGKTVEVLNTDAEGRLILADALSYAQKYNPELVFDLATLTGSAVMAVGTLATVAMGTADEDTFRRLKISAFSTFERIVQMPFWDDYKEMLKSDIADLKNIGGRMAGSITAGKFLEHFTDYPWIHLDIAGPAYMKKDTDYLTTGGTGVGVRLLFDFFKNY